MLAIAGQDMRRQQRRRLRQLQYLLGLCLVLFYYFFYSDGSIKGAVQGLRGNKVSTPPSPGATKRRLPPELLESRNLTEAQCQAAFPGLTKEIEDVVRLGPFKLRQHSGPIQGRIKNGQMTIIHCERKFELSNEMLWSRTSTLHQLNRAIMTSPEPLPDTIFSLNIQDQPFGSAWCYSRHADPDMAMDPVDKNLRVWPMPHYSFWAWPLPFIKGIQPASKAIDAVEAQYAAPHGSWQDKIPKAVWRGTAWWNSIYTPSLRQDLVAKAEGKPWADVIPLIRSDPNATNKPLNIEDFCRYKYVIHTEGVTYSGRFHYHQMCRSVVISAVLYWPQHTTHLVKPTFPTDMGIGTGEKWESRPMTRRGWPVSYKPEEATMVFVSEDWAELEQVIQWLEAHPDIAEGIADRQRELFVGGGYFSPAAETCYWRSLIRGWASVVDTEGEGWDELEGTPFEYWGLDGGF